MPVSAFAICCSMRMSKEGIVIQCLIYFPVRYEDEPDAEPLHYLHSSPIVQRGRHTNFQRSRLVVTVLQDINCVVVHFI